jgi:hypothetical protein
MTNLFTTPISLMIPATTAIHPFTFTVHLASGACADDLDVDEE